MTVSAPSPLSQKTYLPLGSLRETLWYPNPALAEQDAVLQQIMRQVGLEHLDIQLAQERDWAQTLSLGEQQRCAFVRALLAHPAVLFLDESSAAMDATNEASCHQLLKEMLSQMVLISIGHNASLERFHGQVLNCRMRWNGCIGRCGERCKRRPARFSRYPVTRRYCTVGAIQADTNEKPLSTALRSYSRRHS
nr:ATP-binding cassette domain-containing protein [Pseudomonas thivervalensis]